MAIKIPLPAAAPRALPEPGSHLGACFSVIHCGTQDTAFGAKPQLRLVFELGDAFLDDGRPMAIARTYSLSWHPNSALRSDLEGWLGAVAVDFDLADLVGRSAVIGIAHSTGNNGTTYANLTSLLRPHPGTATRWKLVNAPVVVTPYDFDHDMFNGLPDWLRGKLLASPEYKVAVKGGEIAPERLHARLQQAIGVAPADEPKPRAAKRSRLTGDLDDEIPF